MTMYERIKALRESKGLSQQVLAEMVGFKTASAINKIELGLRDINQSKIILLAKALGVSPCYLLTGDNKSEEIPQSTPFASDSRCEHLLDIFYQLNDLGKDKLISNGEDLAALPKYTDQTEKQKPKLA